MTPRILAMRGRGLVSTLIRWQTAGSRGNADVSHIAIEIEPNIIIEAWQGKGVQRKTITDRKNVRTFHVLGLTEAQTSLMLAFLNSQLGKPYDYAGVFGFLSRAKQSPTQKSWFCSELAFAALAYSGIELFKRTQAWEVSPSLLIRSPLLIEIV